GVGRSWNARKVGSSTSESKTVKLPSGVNFKISPESGVNDLSVTKRLPLLSNANPQGKQTSVAKSLPTPSGVNLTILSLLQGTPAAPSNDTKIGRASCRER